MLGQCRVEGFFKYNFNFVNRKMRLLYHLFLDGHIISLEMA